ncbi:MAG TPA: glycosyl hydrolase family 28-related protein, partial [Candidatus Methylacidiphilales bacterium]
MSSAISSFRILCLLSVAFGVVDFGNRACAAVGATVPFTEYEAEAGTLDGGATVVSLTSPPKTQYSSPELEASGHAYVQLNAPDQSVNWTNDTTTSCTAMDVRICIPDSPEGGGTTDTLDLYVDGTLRQAINLSSAQTWLYENTSNYNRDDENPTHGSPRVFFDEARVLITGSPIAPGSKITLKKDSTNTAAFYYIDVIDLEAPVALTRPDDSLSITDFGAVADKNDMDSTAAIQKCINEAQSRKKSVWIPEGTFYLKTTAGLHAKGITIEGAGMWFSTIYRDVPLPNSTPLGAIFSVT